MNTLLKYSIFSLFALATLTACDNTEDLILEEPQTSFDVNSTNFSNLVLNASFPENAALTISWKDERDAGSTYEVVMATDEAFTNEIALGTSDDTNFTISVAALNQLLLNAGAEPYKMFPIYVRIDNGTQATSALSYNVMPYAVDAPVIVNPAANSSIVLDGENPDAAALEMMWTDFSTEGTTVSVVYSLQLAVAGNEFETFQTVGQVTDLNEYTITNSQLNALALTLGAEEEVSYTLETRILATITSDTGVDERLSTPVAFNVTTYSTAVTNLFLVGSATAAEWNNNNNNAPIIRDPNNKNVYSYTAKFLGGGDFAFKLLEKRGQWQPQWGVTNNVFVNNEILGQEPGVLSVATTGYYKLDVNTKTGAYSITPYDASAAPSYTTIGYIGSSRTGNGDGWNEPDANLTQSTFDPHIWYANKVTLFDGELKFRANDSWGVNWGGTTEISGFGVRDSSNIPVSAGTYDIWFNDLTAGYILIPNE
ncbi:SusE domain-containing protein [Leeuwenhoekiella sp. W20_SRS_FM14]|uniref:SusE domain-containing protein n=1 Tax=Leeuwenhoekiella sp. W20_SRS_FM14 TaxID=3240270 RepID=UPI003F9B5403